MQASIDIDGGVSICVSSAKVSVCIDILVYRPSPTVDTAIYNHMCLVYITLEIFHLMYVCYFIASLLLAYHLQSTFFHTVDKITVLGMCMQKR